MRPMLISSPFARNQSVDTRDTRRIKIALNRLGYYRPHPEIGITGIPDAAVFEALKAFQRDHGLPPTGAAAPDDKTMLLLSSKSEKAPEGSYVWRTVGDGQVRESHADLEGKTRTWTQSPDPGEDPNCRCWADPIADSILKGIPDDKILDFLEKSEDNVEYMYLDTKGNVTVGVGMMLPDEQAALHLPFRKKTPAGHYRPATEQDIRQAYRKVRQRPFGPRFGKKTFKPSPANGLDDVRITKAEGQQALRQRLPHDVQILRQKFKGFDTFPPTVRKALIDMLYNLGSGNFSRSKWPKLFEAIDARNWAEAARQSHRKDIQEDRNHHIDDLFRGIDR